MQYDDSKPKKIAVVTDAGLMPEALRHTVERAYGKTFEKGGWINLIWEVEPGGMARSNETGDESGVKNATIIVSKQRALQAMRNLVTNELVC